ncbi:hypothetical protein ACIQFU_38215 [Streptomyces sp. NPDC093065]|uniref:hypothetical protein n=1 Tax=Streptomyces sp. NPDC093065 TaxID=3366021 RepID=UPI0038248F43
MLRNIGWGCAAGAAGTTALNAVGYVDMAVRRRAASNAPAAVVDGLATRLGHPVPKMTGRENRLSALAALAGIATGTGVGIAVSLLHGAGARVSLRLGAALTGAAAMACADVPMALLGVSDPRTWSRGDWASDVVPHLVYGLVTYGIVTASQKQRWCPGTHAHQDAPVGRH